MIIRFVLLSSCAFLAPLSLPLKAQVYTPPAPTPTQSGPTQTTIIRPKQQQSESPFGKEIPLLDPNTETIQLGGKSFPIMDSRLIKARFEKYLNQPAEETSEATFYHQTIQEILSILSPQNSSNQSTESAFKLLPKAATYPGDANISTSLAQAIYTALQAKNDVSGLARLNQALENEKKEIIRDDYWEKERLNRIAQPTSKGSGGKNKKERSSQTNLTMKQKEWQRRMVEIEAHKKKNSVQKEASIMQAKVQYQANMAQWTLQRRFQHVLMAARFYNKIWRTGDNKFYIRKGSDLGKLFTDGLGISPTVNGLDSISNEAIRETQKSVDAFLFLLSKDEIHTASMRLMEAFALGEHLSPIATLPIDKKRRVQLYIRDLYALHSAMEAHDLTRAQELSQSLKKQAKDFPSSKVDSPLQGMMMAANLKIESAKAALLEKKRSEATEHITEATKLWPTNPKLAEFTQLVEGSNVLLSAKNDFDRLLAEKNYREIYNRRADFLVATQGDPKRQEALSTVSQNLTRIEIALAKASEFTKAGSPYDAYEQLALLREEFPDDPKLGREIELLAPQVADFTKALDQARKLSQGKRPQVGSSLSQYLKAQSLHPRSQIAQDGIEQLINTILGEDS